MLKRVPCFAVVVAALALIAYLIPEVSGSLAYGRDEILGGEVWRGLTCFLTHRSASHLLVGVLMLLAAGVWATMRGHRRFPHALLISALGVSGVFLAIFPKTAVITGLSPINSALFAFLCFKELERPHGRAAFWALALALVFLRPMVELFFGITLFTGAPEEAALRALPAAHFIGAVAGALVGHAFRIRDRA